MSFYYGKIKSNGQYENYPTNTDGKFLAPIRNSYIHEVCGAKTYCSDGIAETYARNPKYYGRTFCCQCSTHFPVSEFHWAVDGVKLGEIGGEAGKNLCEDWENGYIN